MKKRKKNILLALPLLLVIIQFFQIDKTTPPHEAVKDFIALENPPLEIATLLHDACYDCHSNLTEYPWYTNVQPVAWWINNHINEGRQHLNFSNWGSYNAKKKAHKAEELVEMVSEKEMPLKSFTWMHPEARLTNLQRKKMVDWLKTVETKKKKIFSSTARMKLPEGEEE
ncbi:MAG: heme-binding domain-containing protein [Saprospiraceae bacterium]